ncbi:glycosyl hydrolase [Nocardioides sp. YIM 152588]|uniref:glycosyl hydrolase n=1 Tax=Nocardioides sp. YIM 152588 TaxID=3158259 RepID=UPI0032E3A39D
MNRAGNRYRRASAIAAAATAVTLVAAGSSPGVAAPGAADHGKPDRGAATEILSAFEKPPLDAEPMARMWFPDAGAGRDAEGRSLIVKQIKDLAAGGFGGVEIAYLADGSNYGNDDAAEIGFGSPAWRDVLKTILKAANKVPGGFKVDLTITSHWPPTVNTIDPNDDTQQQQATSAWTKITADDLAAGVVDLPLPEQRTRDFSNTSRLIADFLFVDKYTGATVAKVASVGDDGTPTFELASLADADAATTKKREEASGDWAGYPAGIPDRAYADANGLDYQDVLDKFGPEPATDDFDGKIDQDGNRRRMADWQYLYQTDLDQLSALDGYSPSAGDDLAVGDLVLIGSYRQGTGQIMSGGQSVTQHNRTYAVDYFSEPAAERIFAFWSDNILDRELERLLVGNARKTGSSIFEDSIEIHRDGPLWTADLPSEFSDENGYAPGALLPVLSMGAGNFDDAEQASRIVEDYNTTLGGLYETEHAAPIKDWASTFGYTYRAQGYSLTGLDIAGAASALDVPEGDNSTSGDGLRNLSATVNMQGKKLLSMESVTFEASINSTWTEVTDVLNMNFSHGVNRSILHGTAFARAFNGNNSAWPGWNFFNFSSWNGRQIWWDDVDTFSDYVARNQAVLQGGQAKVDLAVLLGADDSSQIQSGNSLQTLLDEGWSYNELSEALLELPAAEVTGGRLAADGPAYGAVIVSGATQLNVASVDKLIEFARAGLPVVFLDSDVEHVYGTDKPGNNDALLADRLATLMGLPTVSTAASQDEASAFLRSHSVEPAAEAGTTGLEISRRAANEGDYYYVYNAGTALAAATAVGDTTATLDTVGGFKAGDVITIDQGDAAETAVVAAVDEASSTLTFEEPLTIAHSGPPVQNPGGPPAQGKAAGVTTDQPKDLALEGSGTPYLLNAWTGEITPVAEYYTEDGRTHVGVELGLGKSTVVVLADKTNGFPAAPRTHALDTTGGEVRVDHRGLELVTTEAGDYEVTLPGGTSVVSAPAAPKPIALDDGWRLDLESWGPDAEVNDVDPTVSSKTTVALDSQSLGAWRDLPLTAEQLETLGVESAADISGIGRYRTSFTRPRSWSKKVGVELQLDHGADMPVAVRVNGRLIDRMDQDTTTVDVTKWLRPGRNVLKVKVDTPLGNRTGRTDLDYGLTGVTLTPYAVTPIR